MVKVKTHYTELYIFCIEDVTVIIILLMNYYVGLSLLLGGSPPRVRAYLYGALLYYLQIAQKQKPLHISLTGVFIIFIYLNGSILLSISKLVARVLTHYFKGPLFQRSAFRVRHCARVRVRISYVQNCRPSE